ncbi:translin family protein isoform X2 [Wolffia australiana]
MEKVLSDVNLIALKEMFFGPSSCWRQRLVIASLMAIRPPGLQSPVESSVLQIPGKKRRTLMTVTASSDSAMKEEFAKHAECLNALNDKRERIVKASRDVTLNSKKVIFQIHRISKENKEQVVEKAENDLAAVTDQYMSKLVKELDGTDFWKLRRSYSPAVQEYVEAATFCRFCKTGTLLNLDEINTNLLSLSQPSAEPLQINILDYLLGIADLTGELMRLAIGRVSEGELEYAEKICRFVRDIYRELSLLVPKMDDNAEMKKKMEVMFQSMVKIENALFSVHVRGSEYVPLLGSDGQNFPIPGIDDLES